MRRIIILMVVILAGVAPSFAQQGHPGFEEMLKKIRAERVSFLTKEMDLTPLEAERFWPVYNQYLGKRDSLLKSRRKMIPHNTSFMQLPEEKIDSLVNGQLNTEIRLVELKKEYFTRIRKVLPAKKVLILYRAEQQFMNHMINRMRGRSNRGGMRREGSGRD